MREASVSCRAVPSLLLVGSGQHGAVTVWIFTPTPNASVCERQGETESAALQWRVTGRSDWRVIIRGWLSGKHQPQMCVYNLMKSTKFTPFSVAKQLHRNICHLRNERWRNNWMSRHVRMMMMILIIIIIYNETGSDGVVWVCVGESVREGEAGRRSLERLRTSIRMSDRCEINRWRCSRPGGLLALAGDRTASVFAKETFVISSSGTVSLQHADGINNSSEMKANFWIGEQEWLTALFLVGLICRLIRQSDVFLMKEMMRRCHDDSKH